MLWSLIIGMFVIALGIPIGDYLYRKTREEIKEGQKWFRIIIMLTLLGSIIAILIKNDFLLFTFLFIAIVTSRSLIREKKRIRKD